MALQYYSVHFLHYALWNIESLMGSNSSANTNRSCKKDSIGRVLHCEISSTRLTVIHNPLYLGLLYFQNRISYKIQVYVGILLACLLAFSVQMWLFFLENGVLSWWESQLETVPQGSCPRRRCPRRQIAKSVKKTILCMLLCLKPFLTRRNHISMLRREVTNQESANVLKAHGKFEILIDLIDFFLNVSIWHTEDSFYLNHEWLYVDLPCWTEHTYFSLFFNSAPLLLSKGKQ